MGQHQKVKRKRKSQKNTDKKQSARFIETARELGVDENGEKFGRAISKIISRRNQK
jgi:hypothetical protein